MAVENDVKRRHQEITKQEIHCLDTKETFVASMQLGLECYHHVEARAWAETQVSLAPPISDIRCGGTSTRSTLAPVDALVTARVSGMTDRSHREWKR